jgi:hypothetical protein
VRIANVTRNFTDAPSRRRREDLSWFSGRPRWECDQHQRVQQLASGKCIARGHSETLVGVERRARRTLERVAIASLTGEQGLRVIEAGKQFG